MADDPSQIDPMELIQRYASGELGEGDRAWVDEALARGVEPYASEWAAVRPSVEALVARVDALAPEAGVWATLEARLGTRVDSPSFASLEEDAASDPVAHDAARMVILRGGEMDWRESGVPGVRLRNLFADREHNRLTLLIKMDPGAVFPDHGHPGVEECMVLEGDLSIAGTVLRGGDYLRTPAGATHGEPRTEGGCLLLVTTPMDAAA